MICVSYSAIGSNSTDEETVVLLGAGTVPLVEGPVGFLAGLAAVPGLWFGTPRAGEGAWLGAVVG